MQILCLYNAHQTYTEAVYEHLNSFRLHSAFQWRYLHWEKLSSSVIDIQFFDVIVVHYNVRLAFDQIDVNTSELLNKYSGIKALFIQDEYDNTSRTKYWIQTIGFDIVFSVVPEKNLKLVYPPEEFPSVRFVSVLTGYVPEILAQQSHGDFIPSSQRCLEIGYRGRPLPPRYGALGREKVLIGKKVREYCLKNNISQDIAWTEKSRIYGTDWYRFIASCKAMLGSESGCNVFDWNGELEKEIKTYRKKHLFIHDDHLYRRLIAPMEQPGLMNQVSPRIFEMASFRTAMVLFEGDYSGIVTPDAHFIPLKKDFSNLAEVFERLKDGKAIDEMTSRVYADIVVSGKHSYSAFVQLIDKVLLEVSAGKAIPRISSEKEPGNFATSVPQKNRLPEPDWVNRTLTSPFFGQLLVGIWKMFPVTWRPFIKKLLGRKTQVIS